MSRLSLEDPEFCVDCARRGRKVRGRVVKSIKKVSRWRAYRLRRYECKKCYVRWNAYLSRINPARVKVRGLE
jgi:hypothetical protein